MHAIILRNTNLIDQPIYRVYNFGPCDTVLAYTLGPDGITERSQMYMSHSEAYELIKWGKECGYTPFADSRATEELAYYADMFDDIDY